MWRGVESTSPAGGAVFDVQRMGGAVGRVLQMGPASQGALCRLVPLTLLWLVTAPVAADDMKPYPPPEEGFNRLVFRLPQTASDDDHRIEIVVGKVIPIDCNRTMFIGNLERHNVKGWGYNYYVIREITGPATTLMACADDRKTDQFVQVHGEGFLQRYNHKLPVVVYAPVGFEVRYRIWSAGDHTGKAVPE